MDMRGRSITVCFTYFKSLALANLEAALYSVRQQDLSEVREIIIVDNDTVDEPGAIHAVINMLEFSVPVYVFCFKHGMSDRTHSWSTNAAVRQAKTPWILFCRADYLLDPSLLTKFVEILKDHTAEWRGFVTANVYHLGVDIGVCEQTNWRRSGASVLRHLPGREEDYTAIDAGVWLTRKDLFDGVGGLDERLTAWGHAQTHFQYKLFNDGVVFCRIPEPLFFHPLHAGERDLDRANEQLLAHGISLRQMWERHTGMPVY